MPGKLVSYIRFFVVLVIASNLVYWVSQIKPLQTFKETAWDIVYWGFGQTSPRLTDCNVRTCINRSRCMVANPYIFPTQHPNVSFRRTIYPFEIPTDLMTDHPEEACIILTRADPENLDKILDELNSSPHWHGGKNHVIVYDEDVNWERSLLGLKLTFERAAKLGQTMLWSPNLYSANLRVQFDVPLALPPNNLVGSDQLQQIPAHKRHFLLTFKGTSLRGPLSYDRKALHALFGFEHRGVEIHITCKPNTAYQNLNSKMCIEEAEHERSFDVQYSYEDLMNSTFGLVPGGRQPQTFRLLESIARGVIPVVIEDIPSIPPLMPIAPWHKCLVRIHDEDLQALVPMLEHIRESGQADQLRRGCIEIWESYFYSKQAQTRGAFLATLTFIRGFESSKVI